MLYTIGDPVNSWSREHRDDITATMYRAEGKSIIIGSRENTGFALAIVFKCIINTVLQKSKVNYEFLRINNDTQVLTLKLNNQITYDMDVMLYIDLRL